MDEHISRFLKLLEDDVFWHPTKKRKKPRNGFGKFCFTQTPLLSKLAFGDTPLNRRELGGDPPGW